MKICDYCGKYTNVRLVKQFEDGIIQKKDICKKCLDAKVILFNKKLKKMERMELEKQKKWRKKRDKILKEIKCVIV